jgi:2-C-methyl-D-erythritol 4-phosphate cytidylyltransferase
MNVAVILAGGIGSRVGADRPKQFIEILGKPVLAYTIEVFQKHPEIDAIEVVCHKSWKEYLNKMIKGYGLDKVRWVTDGGETFQESVLNGINYLSDKISRDDMILVHFGASPFIQEYIITDCIKVCKEKGNAISTIDFFLLSGLKHSVKSVDNTDNYTEEYIDRDTVACMNSPHAFNYGFIKDIYDEAVETGVINEVEPHTTTLMFKMGKRIYFSKGSQTNIKITKKEDLDLFEGYVMMKNSRKND